MRKHIFFLLLFFAASIYSYGQGGNHYIVNLKINPKSKELFVKTTLTLSDSSKTDTLKFYLSADLNIKSFKIENGRLIDIETDTAKNFLHTIQVIRNNPHVPLIINADYSGIIDNKHIKFGVGCVTPEWTELSDYVKWVPMEVHNPLFTYQIHIHTNDIYQVSGYGITRKLAAGNWVISNSSPSYRLAVFLSNGWYQKTIQVGKLKVNIHSAKGPDSLTNYLESIIPELTKLYNNKFGEGNGTFNVFFRNRATPVNYTTWAYAATGFVSLYDIQNKSTLFLTFAHELGHNWWHNGKLNTPDEFLSEAFAEYAALMAYREYYPDKFNKRYTSFENSANSAPAINSLQQHPDDRYSILYVKGSVLLFHLEEKIGREQFVVFLKEVKYKNIENIESFLQLLEQMDGKAVRNEFETALK